MVTVSYCMVTKNTEPLVPVRFVMVTTFCLTSNKTVTTQPHCGFFVYAKKAPMAY